MTDEKTIFHGQLARLQRIARAARPFAWMSGELEAALADWDWMHNDGPPTNGPRPFEVGDRVMRKSDRKLFVVQDIEPYRFCRSRWIVCYMDRIYRYADAADFVARPKAHILRAVQK